MGLRGPGLLLQSYPDTAVVEAVCIQMCRLDAFKRLLLMDTPWIDGFSRQFSQDMEALQDLAHVAIRRVEHIMTESLKVVYEKQV